MAPPSLQFLLTAKNLTGKALGEVSKAFDGLKTSAGNVSSMLGPIASGLALFGAGATLKGLVDVNVEFERLRAQLRAFARNDSDAAAQFEAIRQFAVETPFELADLTQAFIELRAAGLKPTQNEFRALGDLASAIGRPINELGEAIKAAGAGNVERLNRFGVTARVMGDQIQVSFQGATTTIERNAQAVQNYLVQLSQSNFAGAMEKQVRTLGGAMSNLQDSIANFAASIGEGGLGQATASAIRGLTGLIDKARELMNLRTGNFSDPIKQEMAILDLMAEESRLAKIARDGVGYSSAGVRTTSGIAGAAAVKAGAETELKRVRAQLAELRREANAMARESAANTAKDIADAARRQAGIGGAGAGAAAKRLPFYRDGTQSPDVAIPGVDGRSFTDLPSGAAAPQFGMSREQDIDLRRQLDAAMRAVPELQPKVAGLQTAFDGLGSSIEAAFAAMVDGSMSAGYAFEMATKMAIANVAAEFARLESAKAAAALATGNFAGGAGHLAASAAFSAIAGGIRGSVNRAARGVGGVGGGAFGVVPTARGLDSTSGEGTIILQGGPAVQVDELQRALQTMTGRRITIRTGLSG